MSTEEEDISNTDNVAKQEANVAFENAKGAAQQAIHDEKVAKNK